jgi:hypothetical protein
VTKKDKGAEWKPPEFDEVEFMKKEMRAAKTTIIVVLWTLPSAILSYGLTLAGVAVVAFFGGIGMMFLLKWIMPLLKVDISEYKRKDWIGHGATFFFSWLAFWILLLNPPFADLTSPVILGVSAPGTAWVPCGALEITNPGNVAVNVSASDNVGVSRVTVSVASGPTVGLTYQGGTLWTGTVAVSSTPRAATVTVVDVSGHTASCSVTFT